MSIVNFVVFDCLGAVVLSVMKRVNWWRRHRITLLPGIIAYQKYAIMSDFFTLDFAILLVKIVKLHPYQEWIRGSSQPNQTKQKCTSGFIIHVAKAFGRSFVDFSSIYMYHHCILQECGVKKCKNTYSWPLVDLNKDLVLFLLALLSKMWSFQPKTILEIQLHPPEQKMLLYDFMRLFSCITHVYQIFIHSGFYIWIFNFRHCHDFHIPFVYQSSFITITYQDNLPIPVSY